MNRRLLLYNLITKCVMNKPFFAQFLENQLSQDELDGTQGGKPFVTHKYPSDNDENVTMKYPSDDDEGIYE